MKVVIAGGDGLIGRRLASALAGRADEPILLSRNPEGRRTVVDVRIGVRAWDPADPAGSWSEVLRGADAIVNLAGASVGTWPWTPTRMRELVASRLESTRTLVQAMAGLPLPDRPRCLINASGTDVYEGRDEQPATEDTAPGTTFLARLCVEWEAEARRAEEYDLRVVLARTSLVVDREAPALQRFALPVRLFAGGRFGSGSQWISWIHIDDVVGLILLALDRDDVKGVINLASPDPRPQAEFSSALAQILRRPFWLPTPATLVRLVMGKQATLVLGSRRVGPARALALGYEFRYPRLEEALADQLA